MRFFLKKKYLLPEGFKSSGIPGGIRKSRQRADTGLIVSDAPCSKAVFFTKNRLKSEHIKHAKKIKGKVLAVFANSGNANVFVGGKGERDIAVLEKELRLQTGIKKGGILFCVYGDNRKKASC